MAYGIAYLEKLLTLMLSRSDRDKTVVRTVIAELNARDVVHAQSCNEHCRATYESVRGLRQAINAQLGKEMSTDLAFVLRELETACRQYMRAMERAGLNVRDILGHQSPEMQTFTRILDDFQRSAQTIGERLSAEYNVILP
jgi:hypothetical protein